MKNNYLTSFFSLALITYLIFASNYTSAKTTIISETETINQLKENKQKQIPIATTISGTIASSIVWTDNSPLSVTRTKIILNEPLLYADGNIAIPENSSLIVEVFDWDDAGFVTLSAIAIAFEDNQGKFIQHPIPKNTLLFKNEDNLPLEFEIKESNKGNSLINGLVFDAIQTGTRDLPLPGRLGSSVSRTIRKNTRRSRRTNSELVYSIQAGTKVSIHVNNFSF